jgi:hypothetical protein
MYTSVHSCHAQPLFNWNGYTALQRNICLRTNDFVRNSDNRVSGMHQQLLVKQNASIPPPVALLSEGLYAVTQAAIMLS